MKQYPLIPPIVGGSIAFSVSFFRGLKLICHLWVKNLLTFRVLRSQEA